MRKTTEQTTPYKPTLREMKMPAVAERLDLPDHAGYVYYALVNRLSARTAGIHADRVVAWFEEIADGRNTSWEGPIVEWARALRGAVPEVVEDAVRVLASEGLIATETKIYQDTEGTVYERTKLTMLPIEEWELDKHFMTALAVRWAT